jgi:hypothetical protein
VRLAAHIRYGTVKGVKEARIDEAVMGLVRSLVKFGAERPLVLKVVQQEHEQVLGARLRAHHPPAHAAIEVVVGAWHDVKHPRGAQVHNHHDYAARVSQVRHNALAKLVRPRRGLHTPRGTPSQPHIMVRDKHHLCSNCCEDAERETDGARPCAPPLGARTAFG